MYTIKQAAARTGLAIPTIRAWERRYGVGTPTRTAAGYRLYDDETITRLRAMRHLIELEGWRPRQAAQRVLSPDADLAVIGEAPFGKAFAAGDDAASPSSIDRATDAFLSAARRLDVQAMEQVLDEAFATQRFERAMDRVVFPALRAIGEAWASGEIDAAREHASSETVRRRLARFFDATGGGDGRPRVLVGLPPASQHDLGAFAFAVAGRRAGMDVLYLGANVPVESWLRTTRETGVETIVLGIVTPDDVPNATAVIDALRATERPPVCLVGGPSSGAVAENLGAIRLPDSIEAGVVALGELIGARAPRA